jgi:hypothetical protein
MILPPTRLGRCPDNDEATPEVDRTRRDRKLRTHVAGKLTLWPLA